MMSNNFLLLISLVSTSTALKLNTPVSDSSLELWNQTALMLFGPYWAQHSSAKRTIILRQLLSDLRMSDDFARRVTLLQTEKMHRLRRSAETGVEVIPGCSESEACTAKSYYNAVLLQSGPGHEHDDDDCCEVLWGDCLTTTMATGMRAWNADNMNDADKSLIVYFPEMTKGFPSFVATPTLKHAHSLLESSSGHHGECPMKACGWCSKHGYKGAHQAALQLFQLAIAPPQLDFIYAIDSGKDKK